MAGCCLSCCKYTAFFGILFYLSMGFIILFQSDYLRFTPENKTDSVIACFITLLLEVGIFIVLTCYERKQAEGNISQPEYIKFDQNQSRPRESSIRGIPLVDLSVLREREMEEQERQ